MLAASRIWADLDIRKKIVPVLLRPGTWEEAAPDFLVALPHFDLSNMAQFEAKYRELLQSVTGQREKAPDIGFLPQIAAEPDEPLRGADPNNRPAQPTGGPGPSKERISRINSLPSFSTSFARAGTRDRRLH
jgi:hypothetical protein